MVKEAKSGAATRKNTMKFRCKSKMNGHCSRMVIKSSTQYITPKQPLLTCMLWKYVECVSRQVVLPHNLWIIL